MYRILLIADDFTGALDTGVRFAEGSAPGTVALINYPFEGRLPSNVSVFVVNTDTRHLEAKEAYSRLRATVLRGLDIGIDIIYKKTDSTLRGNIGAELSALLEGVSQTHGKMMEAGGPGTSPGPTDSGTSSGPLLFFAPAMPDMGRTTKDGRQYVSGVPLHETEFASDPLNPIRTSDVRSIIAEQTDLKVISFGPDDLSSALGKDRSTQLFPKPGPCILLLDSETEEDLSLLANTISYSAFKDGNRPQRGGPLLLAGCAGFAGHFRKSLGGEKKGENKRINDEGRKTELRKPLLVVSGSANPRSVTQADRAEDAGYSSLALTPGLLLEGGFPENRRGKEFLDEAGKLLRSGERLLLRSTKRSNPAEEGPRKTGSSGSTVEKTGQTAPTLDYAEFSNRLGLFSASLLKEVNIGTVIIFGGDLLQSFYHSLSAPLLLPLREIFPGVVLSRIEYEGRSITLVSKAGGFGEPDLLERIWDLCI